ncbi:FAD-dependent oxidoreductase [Eggerthellaceae bacterium 24-137]
MEQRTLMGRRTFVALGATAAGTLLLGLGGCTPTAQTGAETAAGYQAGTYAAAAEGKKGPVSISVTFSENRIETIEVLDSYETPRISAPAFSALPEQIIEYQSLQVDTITGATLASMAIINGVKDCVEQAGGDVKALEEAPGAGKSAETVELDADVVVLGAGAAGMGTAVACSQKGLKVVVLEKCGNVGGNCLVSGGMMRWIGAPAELRATNTEGLEGYYENTLEKAAQLGFPADLIATVRTQHDEWYATGTDKVFDSAEWQNIAALVSLGIPGFDETTYRSCSEYNAESIVLLDWLSSEMPIEFKPLTGIAGFPWPNWAQPTVGENGEGYFRAFDEYLAAQGDPIEFLFQTPAEEILMEGGRAVGARGTCADGTTYVVHAGKAVVVATGGFSGSAELLAEHDDGWGFADMDVIPTTNNFGHTGDGVVMGLAAGATFMDNVPNVMCLPFANAVDFSVESMVGNTGNSLLLNKEGKRFVNETLGRNEIAHAQIEQTDEMCYLISDANNCGIENGYNMFGIDTQQLLANGKLFTADTLEDLAAAIAIDPTTFVTSVNQYNEIAATKSDPDFGRSLFDETSPITTPPFYAFPCHWGVHITCGGLNYNHTNYALTDKNGQDIPGLYGVGEVIPTTGGIMTMSNGLVVAEAITAA